MGLPPIAAVAAGEEFSLALARNGTVWAWGENHQGQLGDGTDVCRPEPKVISRIKRAVAIAAGPYHAFAVRCDGTLWAWGENGMGQLGDGSEHSRRTPIKVDGLQGVAAVAAGTEHTVALTKDGAVWAWGDGDCGQLAQGHNTYSSCVPLRVDSIEHVIGIAAGGAFTTVVRERTLHTLDVTVWQNAGGSVTVEPQEDIYGFGDLVTLRAEPQAGWLFTGWQGLPEEVEDTGLQEVSFYVSRDFQIVAGFRRSRPTLTVNAVPRDGAIVECVPDKPVYDYGETVTLTVRPNTGYSFVRWLASPNLLDGDASATTVSVMMTDNILVTACLSGLPGPQDGGRVWTWGSNYGVSGTEPVLVEGVSDVVDVCSSAEAVLALCCDGTVWSWGNNNDGQLGYGPFGGYRRVPRQIAGLDNVVAVSIGGLHSVALKADGTVWGWGTARQGELGGTSRYISPTPIQVPGLNDIVAIRTGLYLTVAIRRDGTVWSCGRNMYGELGDGTTDERVGLVQAVGLVGVKDVCLLDGGAIALCDDGTVWYWGCIGGSIASGFIATAPVRIPGSANIISLCGPESASMLRSDGALVNYKSADLCRRLLEDPEHDVPIQVSYRFAELPRLPRRNSLRYPIMPDGSLWKLTTVHSEETGYYVEMQRLLGMSHVVTHCQDTYFHVIVGDYAPNTMAVSPAIVGTGNWVYQNTPRTIDRGGHDLRLEVSVLDGAGNSRFEVAAAKVAGSGPGEVMLLDDVEGDPLVKCVAGGMRSDGRQGTGPLSVSVHVTGLDNGHICSADLPLVVRPLGDIDGNGGVEPGDLSAMIQALNGMPPAGYEPRAFDLDANGGAEITDYMLLIRALNGQAIP
ncbi:MAG: hypothetical protein JXL80_15155 [Planctomycetes bacterium]|nr:hypothetical protein [Planctomycetota bacterium]